MMSRFVTRNYPQQAFDALMRQGLHPVLARVFAARGIESGAQLETESSGLIPFGPLKNVREMASILADATAAKKRLLIVADYDSDGATACAVGIRALREFGATVDYIVPNRFEYGYGLTPEIVHLAFETKRPDILITVDNGIASVEGAACANSLGMEVLITDHHLPGMELPEAACIINPNQPGCGFPSKHLAGVGVMFYLMLALRAELRNRDAFSGHSGPNLARLLDLVALGTVADVVKLDDNNRILVHQGLKRIRAGKSCAGIRALMQVAGRDFRRASGYDLGFMLGPRLNAAGRLEDMSLGIECLITDDPARAMAIAAELDRLNRARREIEAGMHDSALAMLEQALSTQHSVLSAQPSYTLSLYDPAWHQGVVGILASRIKDKFHRPVIAFAPGNGDELKGSGRSIAALHLRDALDLVAKRHPGLLLKFGGHAAAAGLTLRKPDLEKFRDAFEEIAQGLLSPADLERVIETDGELDSEHMTLELARLLSGQVWGQGFPQPAFAGRFTVENQRIVGQKHSKLRLKQQDSGFGIRDSATANRVFDAMLFFHIDPLPAEIYAVYRLEINEYNGAQSLQLALEHWSDRV